MILNQKKTKVMMFNYTDNYQFTTRLRLNNENIEVVNKTKLLGVIVSDDLKWEENTQYLVKKANARLELLRKVASFTTSVAEKKTIYVLYIRSILEQSCVVWHSRLTNENSEDLERVQKAALKIILGNSYTNYEEALIKANLDSLKDRRVELCKKFALKCIKNEKMQHMFPTKNKQHAMKNRQEEKYIVNYAKTGRLKDSAIPFMQRLLNNENKLSIRKRMPG